MSGQDNRIDALGILVALGLYHVPASELARRMIEKGVVRPRRPARKRQQGQPSRKKPGRR